jgi:hypothetical protein
MMRTQARPDAPLAFLHATLHCNSPPCWFALHSLQTAVLHATRGAVRTIHRWARHFGYLEDPKISFPLVESIQRIVIRAEIFGQTVPANRTMEHPASATPSTIALWTPKPMMRRVNWSITTTTQWVLKVADSHHKSQLHKLSLV